MQLGLIGLGKMGGNMAERLRLGGHQVVGFDFNPDAVARLTAFGNVGAPTIAEMVKKLQGRRAIWIMVPQGKPVDDTIAQLEPLLNPGDILIDGGNSNYKESMRRHADPVNYLKPIFETLAPAADKGWGHVGPAGAGHFVKMVHNGIEYGMMQAYAEGFTIMEKKEPLHLDLEQVAQIWRYGSVVRSWLLDLTADALAGNPSLDGLQAYVEDSGEGRWTVFEAFDLNVSAPIITESVIRRIRSREENNFTDRMLAIMRNEFGGHGVRKE